MSVQILDNITKTSMRKSYFFCSVDKVQMSLKRVYRRNILILNNINQVFLSDTLLNLPSNSSDGLQCSI